jgi:hypothetical protein
MSAPEIQKMQLLCAKLKEKHPFKSGCVYELLSRGFFFSPTDARLASLKNNFKFALKLTLKDSYMFRCEKHHHQRAHYFSLAKVTVVKMS